MSDFNLARESIEEQLDYNVLITSYENGYEQRRLKNTSFKIIGFKLASPWLTKTEMQVYRDFLISKYGATDSFTFTSPFDDVEYTVRFEPNTFRTNYNKALFKCLFSFKVLP